MSKARRRLNNRYRPYWAANMRERIARRLLRLAKHYAEEAGRYERGAAREGIPLPEGQRYERKAQCYRQRVAALQIAAGEARGMSLFPDYRMKDVWEERDDEGFVTDDGELEERNRRAHERSWELRVAFKRWRASHASAEDFSAEEKKLSAAIDELLNAFGIKDLL